MELLILSSLLVSMPLAWVGGVLLGRRISARWMAQLDVSSSAVLAEAARALGGEDAAWIDQQLRAVELPGVLSEVAAEHGPAGTPHSVSTGGAGAWGEITPRHGLVRASSISVTTYSHIPHS